MYRSIGFWNKPRKRKKQTDRQRRERLLLRYYLIQLLKLHSKKKEKKPRTLKHYTTVLISKLLIVLLAYCAVESNTTYNIYILIYTTKSIHVLSTVALFTKKRKAFIDLKSCMVSIWGQAFQKYITVKNAASWFDQLCIVGEAGLLATMSATRHRQWPLKGLQRRGRCRPTTRSSVPNWMTA